MPVLFALIVCIIQGSIFGFATQSVIDNKGYNEDWFWWGFFFGLLAFVVACAKPQNVYHSPYSSGGLYQRTDDLYKKQILAEGGWTCSCGKVQAFYVSTCSCGKSKRDVLDARNAKKAEESKLQPVVHQQTQSEQEMSNISVLKEYKALLDSGIITQEEFDSKKKQLLAL